MTPSSAQSGSTWHVPGYTAQKGIAVDRAGALVDAVEDASGRRVVLRVLSPGLARDSKFMRRLREQMPKLKEVRGDHLVGVIDLVEQPAAVVSDAVTGPSLTRVIDRGGPLPPAAAFVLFDDCLAGLEVLHRAGLTHGDVRADSIVIDEAGQGWLRDVAVPVPALHAGWNPGTPQYAAPELWAGRAASPASDLYAAAAVFFESLTGKPPYPNLDISGLRRAHETAPLPPGDLAAVARGLVGQGLEKDPAARPPTASEYRQDLDTAGRAMLADDWRDTGRAWLAGAARAAERAPSPPPLAPEPAVAVPVSRPSAPPSDAEADEPAAVQQLWRDRRVWAGAAAALVLLIVIVTLAGAGGGSTGSPGGGQGQTTSQGGGGPLFTAQPGGASPGAADSATSGSPAPTPTTPATTAPTSGGPSPSGQVSPAPATATPTPTPTSPLCQVVCPSP